MNRLLTLSGTSTPILVDGGMGTLLQDRGLEDGGAGELWNVERPDVVRDVHEAYASAGARILTTNTFGGTRPRLQMHGLEDRVHELNEAAAQLARSVADVHGILVAGNLGPTGELMEPLGTMDAELATSYFAEQLTGLRDGGIDCVLIETMSDLDEAQAAVVAARGIVPDAPVIVTMSFDTNLRTMMGVRPADAVRELASCQRDGPAPTSTSRMAAMCCGVEPQQAPIRSMPRSRSSAACPAISAGGESYSKWSPTTCGSPALD